MQDSPCFLSLDLGTTTCRCVAFDVQGHALAKASRETTLFCPAMNHAEADPHEWWSAVREAIRRVLESDSSLASRIAAVGLTGLQHAMVPIDEHGQPMGRVMLWMDQRCQPQINRLNTREKETIEKIAGPGARVVATHSLPKLCWLAENEPELVKKARYFLLPKDYIRYRLTGSIATDPSDAGGTMLYDQRGGGWSPSLVQLSGISLQQLPPIRPSHEVNGFITSEAAALTGLPEGLPVVVGAGDVRATILGMGGESSDQALVYLGTAAWVRFKDSGIGTRLRATATTGAALRWLRDLLGGSYEELVTEAAAVPPGA
ncbi:MAG: hypothetical protein H5T84_05395, partial [Thermoleophilia bacterium]|nr:hypothetical protein [Thermoleophilia bacterium]